MRQDGKTLNKDQEVAVSHFDEVHGMLEFAKDLQKTFATVVTEVKCYGFIGMQWRIQDL